MPAFHVPAREKHSILINAPAKPIPSTPCTAAAPVCTVDAALVVATTDALVVAGVDVLVVDNVALLACPVSATQVAVCGRSVTFEPLQISLANAITAIKCRWSTQLHDVYKHDRSRGRKGDLPAWSAVLHCLLTQHAKSSIKGLLLHIQLTSPF
jgi:hypothetical protein